MQSRLWQLAPLAALLLALLGCPPDNTGGKVATPTFSPAGGEYQETQDVTISTTTQKATIYYTADGSPPTSAGGSVYGAPIGVDATTTLRAIGVKADMDDSDIASATYTIAEAGPEPLIGGTYYMDAGYTHIVVSSDQSTLQLYNVGDDPTANCSFDNRGQLISDSSTGFVVTGVWYRFAGPAYNWCGTLADYTVVQQVDSTTVRTRSSTTSYREAYEASPNVTWTMR